MRILILLVVVVFLQACFSKKNNGLPPELINQKLQELQQNANIPKVEEIDNKNQPTDVITLKEKESDEACRSISKGLTEAFRDINYCEVDEDCKIAEGVCPFGCYFLYNEKISFNSYESDIKNYRKNCEPCQYKCAEREDLGNPKCVDNKCVVLELLENNQNK